MSKKEKDIIRSSSHRKEDISKRAFEELIDPWTNQGWNPRDYGIDTLVELFSPIHGTEDFRPDNIFFLVQLKSTEKKKLQDNSLSISIPVKKVIYWYGSNVPVFFVVYHLTDQTFYGVWVDDELINTLESKRPGWSSKKTVSLRLNPDQVIGAESKDAIKDYVINWKVPSRKIIDPGRFFELKEQSTLILDRYKNLASSFNFKSINSAIDDIYNDLEKSIYRIAVTGLSRVGKSSLINALLDSRKTEISPTGFFQTTGVPIEILPGKENRIIIQFQDGKQQEAAYSPDIIKDYASQEFNEDNQKKVRLLSIILCNSQLEKGVSIYDIPGLDDPDDDILAYTWNTLNKSNAIIYIIDGSPAEQGGFIFKNEYKKHIQELSSKLDKIFLVFNKIDALSSDTLLRLKERVDKDLKKLGLYDRISNKTYYLSTQNHSNKKTIDTVKKLREDIWSYLLQENKFGLVRLSLINQEIDKSLKDLSDILNARLLDNEERQKLEEAIQKVKRKIPQLSQKFRYENNSIRNQLLQSLENRKYNIINNLRKELEKIPIQKPLPGKNEIKKFLIKGINDTIENSNQEYANHIQKIKGDIDNWIEENLSQIREILAGHNKKRIINFNEIDNYTLPEVDLSSSLRMGFLSLAAGFLINPPLAIVSGIIGFFGSLLMSAESRRSNHINKIVQGVERSYNTAFHKLKTSYIGLIKESSTQIEKYISKKLNLYFEDIQAQIRQFEGIPARDLALYESAFHKIAEIKKDLLAHEKLIQQYHSSFPMVNQEIG